LNSRQGKKPRLQIHKHLADFVHDEDGKDTLLIIYYAGHGISDTTTGRLLLAQ
jgi:Caspase domain